MSSFGDIVEQLFLALASHDIQLVCQSLGQMENTSQEEVQREILDHLVKRSQTEIKAVYIARINSIIQSIQRQLNMKSPQHLGLLIDLLGQGSNVMVNVIHAVNYLPLQPPILLTLHERIIDMSLIIIKAYSEEKNMDMWLQRIQKKESLNLLSLDTLLQTIAQILSLLSDYQLFLSNKLANYLPSEREKHLIRELEANYIALEYGYLTSTLSEALESTAWLEIENNVFTAQSVEDACFIVSKVLDRCLLSKSEVALIAILSKIIEVLDPSRDSKLFLLLHAQLHLDKSSMIPKEDKLPSTPAIPTSTSGHDLSQSMTSPFDYLSNLGKAVALASGAMVEDDVSTETPSKGDASRPSNKWLQSNGASLNSLLVEALDINAYIHSDPQHNRLPMQETAVYLNSLVIVTNSIDEVFNEISSAVEAVENRKSGEVITTLLQVCDLIYYFY